MKTYEKVAWLLVYLFSSCLCSAQTDTNFINELGACVQRNEASYYRIRDEVNWITKDYDFNHTLRRMETYNGKTFSIRQGQAKYFHSNGKLSHEGDYHKGHKVGEWKHYTSSGNKLLRKEIMESDGQQMRFYYDTIGGYLKSKGMVDKDGFKIGEWFEYHFRSDSVKWKNHFKAGKYDGEQVHYYREGSIRRIELYKAGKLAKGKQYTPDGKKTKYFPEYAYPSVKFSIPTYLIAQCPCAESLLKAENIELVCFVSAQGEASQWEVNCTKDKVCRKELLEAFKKVKKWRPARYEGEAKDAWYRYTMRYYTPRD